MNQSAATPKDDRARRHDVAPATKTGQRKQTLIFVAAVRTAPADEKPSGSTYCRSKRRATHRNLGGVLNIGGIFRRSIDDED
jgi:hypothetical protein